VKCEVYPTLAISGSEEENKVMKGRYKSAKREAKKIVTIAKNMAYEMLY